MGLKVTISSLPTESTIRWLIHRLCKDFVWVSFYAVLALNYIVTQCFSGHQTRTHEATSTSLTLMEVGDCENRWLYLRMACSLFAPTAAVPFVALFHGDQKCILLHISDNSEINPDSTKRGSSFKIGWSGEDGSFCSHPFSDPGHSLTM